MRISFDELVRYLHRGDTKGRRPNEKNSDRYAFLRWPFACHGTNV